MRADMNGYGTECKILPDFLRNSFVITAIAAALTLLPGSMPPAFAAENAPSTPTAPSAADQHCLSCHGAPGMEKKLEDGAALQLHVPADLFAKSVHSPNTCASCHSDINPAAHPPAKKEIKSARSFAVEMNQVCNTCHKDKFDQWGTSIHAALVRAGNPAAPICTDCHSPHAVIKGAAATIEQAPCKTCHADIYTAYLGSMHAKARLNTKDSYAPTCSGCHTAHDVKPIAAGLHGQGPEAACFGCHAGALEAHQKWLPNSALHFEVVSCAACHAPTAQRKVELMLIDSEGKAQGTEKLGVPLFEASAVSGGNGIDSQALWKLLQTVNSSGLSGKTVLRGRLDVLNGPQAHQLADKSKAISDCHTCHRQGSQAFQSVTISLVGPQGRRVGYGASADVLNSAFSVDSVSGFYAIGGTRIKLLDILLILAILGGGGIAVGHVALGWLFKFYGFYHPHGAGHGKQPGGGGGPKAA